MVKENKNNSKLYIIAGVFVILFIVFLGILFNNTDRMQNIYNVENYGATGDGKTDSTASIQQAINDCSNNGGGQVYFPPSKTFITGPVELKSNCDIHLSANSVWKANEDYTLYTMSAFRENTTEGNKWIWCKDCQNLSFSGNGEINGNDKAFVWEEREDYYEHRWDHNIFDYRAHTLTLENVSNLKIHDITVANSVYWTIHCVGCYDVDIDHVSVKNDLKVRNCDGIDLDHTKKARISNCYIESGDDSICLKNRREYAEYGDCEDIVIENCVMTSRSCTVKIGSENVNRINNVTVSNCVITQSNRGIGIQNRHEGTVSNVSFNNITMDCKYHSDRWWGKAEPIYVTSYPRKWSEDMEKQMRFPVGAKVNDSGEVWNIFFNNINCTSENGCFIGGNTPTKVHDVYFSNVNLQLSKITNYPGGIYDCRPRDMEDEFIHTKTYGLYVESGYNIVLRDFDIIKKDNFPDDLYGGKIFGL